VDILDLFTSLEGTLPLVHATALVLLTKIESLQKPIIGQENTRIVNYTASSFTRMARVITFCLSTLLPSIAVLVLYYIDELTARLGAIIGLSAMFSLVLALFTNARPIEIFTATASYVVFSMALYSGLTWLSFAAVQVVFVGGTDPTGQAQYLYNYTSPSIATPTAKAAVSFVA
jgi:hypothetical protein